MCVYMGGEGSPLWLGGVKRCERALLQVRLCIVKLGYFSEWQRVRLTSYKELLSNLPAIGRQAKPVVGRSVSNHFLLGQALSPSKRHPAGMIPAVSVTYTIPAWSRRYLFTSSRSSKSFRRLS